MKLKTTFLFSILVGIFLVQPQIVSAEIVESWNSFIEKFDSFGPAFVERFNEKEKYGKISGHIKSFTITSNAESYTGNRSVQDNPRTSSSTALFLNYQSPEFHGLMGGLEYVQGIKTYDARHAGTFNDGYQTHNSNLKILNQLYVDYNFEDLGFAKSHVKIGRQATYNDFMTKKPIRQKSQAMEGFTLFVDEIPDVKLTLGHINRFSGWSSRNIPTLPTDFRNLGEVAGVSYDTNGAEFLTLNYKGIPTRILNKNVVFNFITPPFLGTNAI